MNKAAIDRLMSSVLRCPRQREENDPK